MRCFNHPEREAIGLCKQCSKGLCPDCATDLVHGLACRGIHEEDVERIHTLVSRNVRIQSTVMKPRNLLLAPLFFMFLGITLIGGGIYANRTFLMIMGIGMMVFAYMVYKANMNAYGTPGEQQDPTMNSKNSQVQPHEGER